MPIILALGSLNRRVPEFHWPVYPSQWALGSTGDLIFKTKMESKREKRTVLASGFHKCTYGHAYLYEHMSQVIHIERRKRRREGVYRKNSCPYPNLNPKI